MAKRGLVVQHLVACPAVEVARAEPGNPYTLRDVTYDFDVPPDTEWPARLNSLYLFARFFNGAGEREFRVRVVWMDAPGRGMEVCEFAGLRVRFPRGESVKNWVWNLTATPLLGAGRYEFRLRDDRTGRTLKREYIRVRRTV